MPITHQWNGTVLTITSDSGTSSADLKGQKGDDGARGPQGQAGSTIAENTSKLDGKDAKYYIQTHNHFDNSNFEIAQAGYSSNHGTDLYFADRWLANKNTKSTYQKTNEGAVITSSIAYEGQIWQVVAVNEAMIGKTFTFAIKSKSNYGRVGMLAYCYDANDSLLQNKLIEHKCPNFSIGIITFTIPANTKKIRCYINNRADDTFTVEWACLYEGEYTAETLPPYTPKGYAVELAECQRYYWQMVASGSYLARLRNNSTSTRKGTELGQWFGFPTTMRVIPSISIVYKINDGEVKTSDVVIATDGGCSAPYDDISVDGYMDIVSLKANADL